VPLVLRLPGRWNLVNAALALVAAEQAGVPLGAGATRLSGIREVTGRYRSVRVGRCLAQLHLVKNPAGWAELLDYLTVPVQEDLAIVIAVNGDAADGVDLSWLWDVPFERLRGRSVAITGRRRTDLAVRLRYADVAFATADDVTGALNLAGSCTRGVVAASYTAFQETLRDLSAA
jgi:UDP-N-acetylmuramyl tripeptide synthase